MASETELKEQLLQDNNSEPPPNKKYITPDMTPIERYNLVIRCYNMPCNIINSTQL